MTDIKRYAAFTNAVQDLLDSIAEKDARIAELEKKEVSLVLNQNGVNKIKADAVREAIRKAGHVNLAGRDLCFEEELYNYADKLERGEV